MHRRPNIVFFVSAGRSGTQWLAYNLRNAYGDLAEVTHEPLGVGYRPKEFLRMYEKLNDMLSIPEIASHFAYVAQVQDTGRDYIETGWPCYAAIPLFIEQFGADVKLVHLTRHPVPTAISLMTQNLYCPERRDDADARLAELEPSCSGMTQKSYGDLWNEVTFYEKCLFWWTEIHLYATELHDRYPDTAFIQLKMEDLLDGDPEELRELVSFLGLPFRESLSAGKGTAVDGHRYRTHHDFQWRQVFNHPLTVTLARRFGYDLERVDEEALDRRYRLCAASSV
ncbi:MAG: sulfotransferase domain-containing protein [Armatimonadetes bacterium]|nr:sulfotransferase domain-containing protein [Armatimonadota bacterium]